MSDAPERTPLLVAMHNDSLNWPSFVADFLAVYAPRIGQLERSHAELERAIVGWCRVHSPDADVTDDELNAADAELERMGGMK